MAVVKVGQYNQWAPSAKDVLAVLRVQAAPVTMRELRQALWEYQKQRAGMTGQVYYIHYPTLKKVVASLLESEDIKKVKNPCGWPKLQVTEEGRQEYR